MGDIVYVIGPTAAESSQIEDALASEPVTVMAYDSAELLFNQVTATASGCVLDLAARLTSYTLFYDLRSLSLSDIYVSIVENFVALA